MRPTAWPLALAGLAAAASVVACADFDGLHLRDERSAEPNGTDPSGTDPSVRGDGEPTDADAGASAGEPRTDGGLPASNGADSGPAPTKPGDVLCYIDADEDGVPGKNGAKIFNPSCPSGWFSAPSNAKYDCDDGNDFVHPGQTAFSSVPAAGGSFDFDCNGIESKDRPYVLDCGTVPAADCSTALLVTKVDGVLPNVAADIKCGSDIRSYRCKISGAGNCVINEASSVAGNVACR